MASAESSARPLAREPQSEQEVIDIFQKMKQEVSNIWNKINELEMELQEHGLVLQTLEPLDKDRKCVCQEPDFVMLIRAGFISRFI